MPVIFEYILNNFPSISIGLIVVFVSFYTIRKFTKWEDKHNSKHDSIENSFSKNEKEHENILDRTTEILKKIDILERFLIKNSNADYNAFTQMNSPIQLNPLGRRVFNDSGAQNFFDRKKEPLLRLLSSDLAKLKTVTALDVENYAYRLCTDVSDNEDFKDVKNFIFNHPIYNDIRLSVGTICKLMSIELRNAYLDKHPEINTE